VPQGGEPETVWRSVADPVLYAGGVLRMQLEAVGVSVGGPLRAAVVPADAVELLEFEGESLGRVVGLFMKYSSNPIGEMLVKGLGRAATGGAGSWKNGRRAVRASLERLGLDLSGFQGVDGSGLARANRVAPRTLVQALQVARDSFRFGPELMAALPIAARDGTLKKRMEGSPDGVRAKTGLLDGVTALSGYADSPYGVLVFSVISNGHTRGDEPAMDALDGFAAALSRRERAAR
jgi:D-alanyl-D-alanine carboxypeptidase/D-alanyl-D-alanine-endopeptidase (penicillin-binding protein 4)